MTLEEIKADMDMDLSALIKASEDMFLDDDEDGDGGGERYSAEDIENDPELFEKEFAAYKRNYYMTKMGYGDFNE